MLWQWHHMKHIEQILQPSEIFASSEQKATIFTTTTMDYETKETRDVLSKIRNPGERSTRINCLNPSLSHSNLRAKSLFFWQQRPKINFVLIRIKRFRFEPNRIN